MKLLTMGEFWAVFAWGAAVGAFAARWSDIADRGAALLERFEAWLDDLDPVDLDRTPDPTVPPRLPRTHVRTVPKERHP